MLPDRKEAESFAFSTFCKIESAKGGLYEANRFSGKHPADDQVS